MKKIFTIILAFALLCLGLTSCDFLNGNSDSDNVGITAADLECVSFEDMTVTYDGSEKNLFATNVPEGVRVVYEGNGKISAGEYTVNAKFYYGEELLLEKSATLTVSKAKYDMSGVSFSDKTVTYSREEYSIEISGNLPAGVSVSYTGNGKQA